MCVVVVYLDFGRVCRWHCQHALAQRKGFLELYQRQEDQSSSSSGSPAQDPDPDGSLAQDPDGGLAQDPDGGLVQTPDSSGCSG